MSEANVDLVRRWAEYLSRGELPLELSDPELRLDNIAQFPVTGPYHGHDGLRRWWRDVEEPFDEIRFEIEQLIDLDDERVLSVQRVVGRFKHGYPDRHALGFAVVGQGRQDRSCRRLCVAEPGT